MTILVKLIDGDSRLPYEKLRVLVQYAKGAGGELIFTGIDSESFLTEVVQAASRLAGKCRVSIYPCEYRLRDHQIRFCEEAGVRILSEYPESPDALLSTDGTLSGRIRGTVTETGITGEIDEV